MISNVNRYSMEMQDHFVQKDSSPLGRLGRALPRPPLTFYP